VMADNGTLFDPLPHLPLLTESDPTMTEAVGYKEYKRKKIASIHYVIVVISYSGSASGPRLYTSWLN